MHTIPQAAAERLEQPVVSSAGEEGDHGSRSSSKAERTAQAWPRGTRLLRHTGSSLPALALRVRDRRQHPVYLSLFAVCCLLQPKIRSKMQFCYSNMEGP